MTTQKVESMSADGERGHLIVNFEVYQDKELSKYSKGKRWKKPPEFIVNHEMRHTYFLLKYNWYNIITMNCNMCILQNENQSLVNIHHHK